MCQYVQNADYDASPQLRILIIDSSLQAVRNLQRTLSSQTVIATLPPFTVHYCSTGIEAITSYLTLEPDCIFVADELTDMSGLTVINHFYETVAEVKSTIILMADAYDNETSLSAMKLGIQEYVVKSEMAERNVAWIMHRAQERGMLQSRVANKQAELSNFAGTAAHDIITPLSNLSLFVEYLQEEMGEVDDDLSDSFNTIISIVDHMTSLTDSLSTFAQMDGNQTSDSCVDLQQIYDYMLVLFDYELEQANAVIDADPLPNVYGNQVGLSQLFQNLIENAIKYRNDEQLKLTVRIVEVNGCWLLSVSDNGIGIEPKFHRDIFAPFQRLHSRAEYPGSGLGLATCKRVVDQHGGRIWVESELGQGTTVNVLLPNRLSNQSRLANNAAEQPFRNDVIDEDTYVGLETSIAHRYPQTDWDSLLDDERKVVWIATNHSYGSLAPS